MTIGNVIDDLIRLEQTIGTLYAFFAKKFPDDAPFWNQITEEEYNHAKVLEGHKQILPLEFQKMDKGKLIRTIEGIRDKLDDYKVFPPSREEVLNYSYLIENNIGELHYQALMDSASTSEAIKIFQILNFGDRDHAKRINEYLLKGK